LVGCVLRTIAEVSDMAMALWCFNPLLTLGRVKSPANRDQLARLLAKMPPLDWPPFEVKELILFQSVLSPRGSKYTPLEVIKLGGKET
jgi:2'-5' RNA ligase